MPGTCGRRAIYQARNPTCLCSSIAALYRWRLQTDEFSEKLQGGGGGQNELQHDFPKMREGQWLFGFKHTGVHFGVVDLLLFLDALASLDSKLSVGE